MKQQLFFLFALITLCIGACKETEITTSNKKPNLSQKYKGAGSFINADVDNTVEKMYQSLQGSEARLQAMLCGKFAHYILSKDSLSKDNYNVWLVNDGKDSIVLYSLPVGDHRKIGRWIYMHQCLTTLPDEPTFSAFAKLTKIDRDTVKCAYYEVPTSFSETIQDIITKPKESFNDLDFNKISSKPSASSAYFIRESMFTYYGRRSIEAYDAKKMKIKFTRYCQDVFKDKMHYFKIGYDENQDSIGKTKGDFFLREALINPELLH